MQFSYFLIFKNSRTMLTILINLRQAPVIVGLIEQPYGSKRHGLRPRIGQVVVVVLRNDILSIGTGLNTFQQHLGWQLIQKILI